MFGRDECRVATYAGLWWDIGIVRMVCRLRSPSSGRPLACRLVCVTVWKLLVEIRYAYFLSRRHRITHPPGGGVRTRRQTPFAGGSPSSCHPFGRFMSISSVT